MSNLDEVRAAICGIGVVGQIDGHDVIRRNSAIELIDRRREAAADKQARFEAWARNAIPPYILQPSKYDNGSTYHVSRTQHAFEGFCAE